MTSTPAIAIPLAFLLLIGPGAPAAAAQRAPAVELVGRVIDDASEEPVPGARVTATTSWGQRLGTAVTDDLGRFRLEVRRRTGVVLRAARFGYREATTPFLNFDGRDFFSLEIRLGVDAVLLAPLEVVARSDVRRSPLFTAFDDRVRTGFGSYFTRAEIERIGPLYVTDLLTRVPGVHLEGGGQGNRRLVRMAPEVRIGACPVQVFMDGRLMNRRGEISIDDLVAPGDVEGIEVYRGAASVPPEFHNQWARCGVVAIWTRRG